MNSDQNTTVAELRALVRSFVNARDWNQFHSPKNLSMSVAIEAAELMEHFQWLTVEESRRVAHNRETLQEIGEELADVLCYALALANQLELDISQTLQSKMRKNQAKYPAETFRGRFRRNTEDGYGDNNHD